MKITLKIDADYNYKSEFKIIDGEMLPDVFYTLLYFTNQISIGGEHVSAIKDWKVYTGNGLLSACNLRDASGEYTRIIMNELGDNNVAPLLTGISLSSLSIRFGVIHNSKPYSDSWLELTGVLIPEE